jgi:hypothetical protein
MRYFYCWLCQKNIWGFHVRSVVLWFLFWCDNFKTKWLSVTSRGTHSTEKEGHRAVTSPCRTWQAPATQLVDNLHELHPVTASTLTAASLFLQEMNIENNGAWRTAMTHAVAHLSALFCSDRWVCLQQNERSKKLRTKSYVRLEVRRIPSCRIWIEASTLIYIDKEMSLQADNRQLDFPGAPLLARERNSTLMV